MPITVAAPPNKVYNKILLLNLTISFGNQSVNRHAVSESYNDFALQLIQHYTFGINNIWFLSKWGWSSSQYLIVRFSCFMPQSLSGTRWWGSLTVSQAVGEYNSFLISFLTPLLLYWMTILLKWSSFLYFLPSREESNFVL